MSSFSVLSLPIDPNCYSEETVRCLNVSHVTWTLGICAAFCSISVKLYFSEAQNCCGFRQEHH